MIVQDKGTVLWRTISSSKINHSSQCLCGLSLGYPQLPTAQVKALSQTQSQNPFYSQYRQATVDRKSRSPIQSKKTFYSLLKIENLCKSGLLQVNNVFEEISPSVEQQTRRLHTPSHAKGIYLNSQSIWAMAIVVIANSTFVTWQLIWKVPIYFHGFRSRFNKRQSLGAGLSILCHLISSAAFKDKFGQHTQNTF